MRPNDLDNKKAKPPEDGWPERVGGASGREKPETPANPLEKIRIEREGKVGGQNNGVGHG